MGKHHNLLIIYLAALGSLTYGFSVAVIGSVLGVPAFLRYFHLESGGQAESVLGATSALFAGGCALGALFEVWAADRFGRVRTLQMLCTLAVISSAIQGGAAHIAMFLVGRLFNGVAVGALLALVPVYMVEISPAATRGLLVGSHGFLIVTGHALAAWTGYACFFSTNEAFQWRFELSSQALAPLLLLLATRSIPESPRWLVEQGRGKDALQILCDLHSDEDNSEASLLQAEEEFRQVNEQALHDKAMLAGHGKMIIFKKASYRKRVLCGMATMFLSQSTGVLVINNYQVSLYNGLGLYGSLPLLLYAIYLTWAAALNYFSATIMDRVGRVRLLLGGLIGCSIMIICEMAMVAQFSGTANKIGNAFGVVFLFLYVGVYAVCLDATIYVYSAEIFPTHMRATGMGLCIFAQSCSTLLYTQAAPTAFGAIAWKYYFVFFLVPLVGAGFVWRYWPETKGATLEDIGLAFGDEITLDGSMLESGVPQQINGELAPVDSITKVNGGEKSPIPHEETA